MHGYQIVVNKELVLTIQIKYLIILNVKNGYQVAL